MDMRRCSAATESVLITLPDLVKDEKRIFLKVQAENEANNLCYWMGRETPLLNLMLDYTQRTGVALNAVRFHYKRSPNGSPIYPPATANKYEMEDGDVIDVIEWEGYKVIGVTISTLITLPWVINGEKPVVLIVQGVDGSQRHYLIGRNTPLDNLLLDYAERTFQVSYMVRLIYNGLLVGPGQTANDWKMEDGDIIRAVMRLSS